MTTTVLTSLVDAFVDEARPAINFAEAVKLLLSNQTNARKEAYLFFGGGPRPGVYVTSATLRLTTRLAWTGSPVLTVRRVTEPWRERAITWKQQPADTSADSATESPGTPSANTIVSIDVTDMVRTAFLGSGAPFYGFHLSTSGTADRLFHSSEAKEPAHRPALEIVFSRAPTQAVDLVPGDDSVVSVTHPVLGWTHYDEDGDLQTSAQVQIDAGGNFDDPEFDTG